MSALSSYPSHGGELVELFPTDHELMRARREEAAGLPRVTVSGRQLFDLELLLSGGFSPLTGFMDHVTYERVRDEMRLPAPACLPAQAGAGRQADVSDGALWPMPIVLDIQAERFHVGDRVALCDPYNTPLAIMTVSDQYRPDKEAEAQAVYGTTDRDHFGVRYLMERTGAVYLGGELEGIGLPAYADFTELRFTPRQLRDRLAERGWSRVVGFQTRNPLHRAHYDIIRRAAADHDAGALIHPAVGETKDGDIDHVTRVRAYQQLHRHYMSDVAELSLLPLAMRMAGPREALWHAIIRKNFGCSHFIIGRDHAGPGKNAQGEPFYGDYDAQELVEQYRDELGIEVVPMKKVVYADEEDAFIPEDELRPHHTVRELSGTEFRRMLADGEEIPSWFSFPEVLEVLRTATTQRTGVTVFFTGLSGAGKSTVARRLAARIREAHGWPVTLLDGDVVRENLSQGLGFSKADRDTNIERIGFVAREVTKHGGIAICSAIAPYAAAREANRRRVEEVGAYVEVYVATSIDTCRARDVKGLYAKADRGEIERFTGVSDPYEEPIAPEVTVDGDTGDPDEAVDRILRYIQQHTSVKL